jgi:glycosyltransferase involved in cell wall biosynthesis
VRVAVIGRARSLIRFRGALLKQILEAGHDITVFAAELTPEHAAGLRALGVRVETYPLARAGLGPLNDLKTYLSLVAGFRRVRPEVTLAYNIKPVIYAGLAAKRVGGIASWSLITGLGHLFTAPSFKTRLLRLFVAPLYRASLRANVGQFFQNPDDLQELAALRICDPDKATLVAGSGVDIVQFPLTPMPEGKPNFLFVGRFLVQKGINELVSAMALVKQRYPAARLQLVGSTDNNPSSLSAEEVERLVVSGIVENLGWMEDVRPAIADASVMVLPSHREGTPRSVLEAMSMGRAILTTDAPGCRETVVHQKNGLLVPLHDVQALADAMIYLYENLDRVQEMGVASRKYVETRFDVNLVNQQMLEAMRLA